MSLETDDSFDAASRELCPDGSCTGVLDADGVCKVCGAKGAPPVRPATEYSDGAGDLAQPFDEMVDDAGVHEAAADDEAPFDENRRLCPDDNCIGVLDDSGACKVCGRREP